MDVRNSFRSADQVCECAVFDILGNNYRLITRIDDYQERHTVILDLAPHELLQALLEESGKRQTDLVPIFSSRSRVSDAVNGKRAVSKEQAKQLGEYFRVSPAAFI